jgi:hydrogenase/urease accessory protein HupE
MSRRAYLFVGLLTAALWQAPVARAHDARPAYLEIDQAGPERYEVLWRIPVLAGMRLPIRLRLPDEMRTVGQPTEQEYRDSVVERRVVHAVDGLAGRRVEFPGLETTITDVLVRVQRSDGAQTTTMVRPSQPWIEIPASRGRLAVGADYLRHGVAHILLGYDHLLFVFALCLIVPSRHVLLATITSFTVAHSLTLAVATLGVVRAPSAPVEASIALSILLLASEVLRLQRGEETLTRRCPWLVAFGFGLLHGFGFASALVDVGIPQSDVPLALFAFNVGVELGQVAFISAVLTALGLARRVRVLSGARPYARPAAAYTIGTLAAFWFFERLAGFFS